MAYSKTPAQSTYSTKTIKLLQQWETRDTTNTKDNDVVNCFFEVVKDKTLKDKEDLIISRSGTQLYGYTVPSTNIRGAYYWEDQDKLYIAYDQSIAVVTGSTGVFISTITPGFAAGTSDIGFTEFNYGAGATNLVVSDGTVLGTISAGQVFTASVSANLPVPHNPQIVFLDGYLFLVKVGTADIYNSNVDAPLVFTAGNFISAEMLPDNLIRVARLNNYLLAFGTNSVEYFYDAANATGSPLQRNDTPIKLLGFLGGLANYGTKIMFVGQTSTNSPSLFMLEDFKITEIDVPVLRRYVEPFTSSIGSVVSFGGHDFYILNVGSLTYMVDLMSNTWTRLSYKQTGSFPIKFAVNLPISGYGNTTLVIQAGVATPSVFKSTLFLDDSVDFTPTIVTSNEFFESYKTKFGGRLSVIGDRTVGSLDISWSDDDYQTFSTPRTIVLNQNFPSLNALGAFRRRAHKVVHRGNCLMRLVGIEMDINLGSR